MKNISRCIALSMLPHLGMCGLNAFAQEGESIATLEEVVVSARKRAESIQDVPVAVSALSSDTLEKYAVATFEDIANLTPELIVGTQSTQTGGSITLRGVGAGTDNPATTQLVSINLDGVQVSQANVLRLGQVDLRQVEVLKGPQALYFGKNSPGGIISLTSNDPTEEFEASFWARYNWEMERKVLGGVVSGAITDNFMARLSVEGATQNGWIENIAEPWEFAGFVSPAPATKDALAQDELFGRLTLLYTNHDNLDVKFKWAYTDLDRDKSGPAHGVQISECPFGSAQLSGESISGGLVGVSDACKLNDEVVISPADPATAALHPSFGDGTPFLESKQTLASLSLDYDLTDELSLVSVTGYYNLTEDSFDNYSQTDLSLVFATSELENEQVTQEFRLQSNYSGKFNFTLGAFYQDAELNNLIPVAIGSVGGVFAGAPGAFMLALPDWTIDTESISVFGQVSYLLTDTLELSVGARWTDEEKELSGTTFGIPINPDVDKISNDNVSPEVSLKWDWADDHMVYAAYKEGFVSGGFNITSLQDSGPGADPSFEPSTVEGFEVGAKGSAFDRRLQYATTVYRYEYVDIQLSTFDADTLVLRTLNAAESTVQGVEISGNYLFESVPGLVVNFGVAYNDTEYDSFIASCYAGQLPTEGCNLNFSNGQFNSQDLSGEPLVRAPELVGSFGARYEFELTNALGLSMSALASYTDEYQPYQDSDPAAVQDSFWIFDANITLSSLDGHWSLALIGRNLGDELYAISTRPRSFGEIGTGTPGGVPADLTSIVSAPRQIMAEFRYNFF